MKTQPSRIASVTPTVDTSAYATGDQIGGLMAFDFNYALSGGVITSVVVLDNASQETSSELWLFDSVVGVAADNAAASFTDADLAKLVGIIDISSGDYRTAATNSAATRTGLAIPVQVANSRGIIFGALVSRGAPTYVAATDITIRLGVLED